MNSPDEDIGRPKHAHISYRRASRSPAPSTVEGSREFALHRLPPMRPQNHAGTPYDQASYRSQHSPSPGRLRAPRQQSDSNSSIQLVQPLYTPTSPKPPGHSRSPFPPTTDGASKYGHIAQPYGPGSWWNQPDQDLTSQGDIPPIPIAVLQNTPYGDYNYEGHRHNSPNSPANSQIELQVSQKPSFSNLSTVSRKTPRAGSPGLSDISWQGQEHHYSWTASAPGYVEDPSQDHPLRPPPRDPPSAVPLDESDDDSEWEDIDVDVSTRSLNATNPYRNEATSRLNRAIATLRIKAAFKWMHPRFFHQQAFFSWSYPFSFQFPGRFYSDGLYEVSSQSIWNRGAGGDEQTRPLFSQNLDSHMRQTSLVRRHRYLDAFRRKFAERYEHKILDCTSGELVNLVVQSTDPVYDSINGCTWCRTYIENVSPYIVRLAYWTVSHKDSCQSGSRKVSFLSDSALFTALRWLPASIGLLFVMMGPTDAGGMVRNNGHYDAFPYRFWRYMRDARNMHESKTPISAAPKKAQGNASQKTVPYELCDAAMSKVWLSMVEKERETKAARDSVLSTTALTGSLRLRPGHPRYLNILSRTTPENPTGLTYMEDLLSDDSEKSVRYSYIVVSYTGEHFPRAQPKHCAAWREQFQPEGEHCAICTTDKAFHDIAWQAAEYAQVDAYWTDRNCLSRDEDLFGDDIYNISDMVRNAEALVVALGDTPDIPMSGNPIVRREYPPEDKERDMAMLRHWGSRLWCLPEFLLASPNRDVSVYFRRKETATRLVLSRAQMCSMAFEDGTLVLSLLDHYDGSTVLSRLELVILALEALLIRVRTGTSYFADGDLSYALMGLLRQRPKTKKRDSAFQAFARLSLANDNDRLLERMVCVLPKDPDAFVSGDRHYWATLDDHFDTHLWDIEPYIQIAGIDHHDTVIIDGAFAATIHWDAFRRVAVTTKETWSRIAARFLVRSCPGWVLLGIFLLNFRSAAAGAFFLTVGLIIMLLSPTLILHVYGGKVWSTQPWLFGFEGHMEKDEIEKAIFGFPSNRLTWAPFGSSLSQHSVYDDDLKNECRGIDPMSRDMRDESLKDPGAKHGRQRLFTLVDTNTMTVTLISALRPPVVALLCAAEGGMQRAVLCSFHWPTQTLRRETVIRMETRVLEKMSRVNRVAFSFRQSRAEHSAKPGHAVPQAGNASEQGKAPQPTAEQVAQDETTEIDWSSVYQALGSNNHNKGWGV